MKFYAEIGDSLMFFSMILILITGLTNVVVATTYFEDFNSSSTWVWAGSNIYLNTSTSSAVYSIGSSFKSAYDNFTYTSTSGTVYEILNNWTYHSDGSTTQGVMFGFVDNFSQGEGISSLSSNMVVMRINNYYYEPVVAFYVRKNATTLYSSSYPNIKGYGLYRFRVHIINNTRFNATIWVNGTLLNTTLVNKTATGITTKKVAIYNGDINNDNTLGGTYRGYVDYFKIEQLETSVTTTTTTTSSTTTITSTTTTTSSTSTTVRPHITVNRGNTTIDKNFIRVEFNIRNDGNSAATDIELLTEVSGFVPAIEPESDYSSQVYNFTNHTSIVKARINSLASGNSTIAHYNLVPVLTENAINYEIDNSGVTRVSYKDSSGRNYNDSFITQKTARDDEIYDAIWNNVDYLIVTSPVELYGNYNDNDIDRLLTYMSKLAKEKNGVLGFTESRSFINLELLINDRWNRHLNENWHDSGYLLIVGETEIIESFSIEHRSNEALFLRWPEGAWTPEFVYSITSTGSDNMFADIDENDEYEPELIVGRIIGNEPSILEKALETVISRSFKRNSALIASGCGEGSDMFRNNAIDVMNIIDNEFNVKARLDMCDYPNNEVMRDAFDNYTLNTNLIYWRGHGGWDSWGAGFINISNVDNLNFGNSTPFIFSSACHTGNYEGVTGLAEAFLTNRTGIFIGSTEKSYRSYNNNFGREFFGRFINANKSIGQVFKETKVAFRASAGDSSREKTYRGYTLNVYNIYGDPKFGMVGSKIQGQVIKKTAGQSPTSSINITIPMYTVSKFYGVDIVKIPGGMTLLEPDRPEIPFYRVTIRYPKGYQIRDVSMVNRGGLIQETGLNIPRVSIEEDGIQEVRNSIATQESVYPEKEFGWEYSEDPDSSIYLLISIYPFYYDNDTGNAVFYQNYSFRINYSVSSVEIPYIYTDREKYIPGDMVVIGFGVNNSGSQMGIIVNGTIEIYGTGVSAYSLTMSNLTIGLGITNSSIFWNSSGFDSGYYLARVVLEDVNGYRLDSAVSRFKSGIEAGAITRFDTVPKNLTIGESLNISMDFNNTGTENLTGIATIRIFNSNGTIIKEFTHNISDLIKYKNIEFKNSWVPEKAGIYEIIGFVLYQGESTGPESSVINVMNVTCDVKGDENCNGIVDDFELLGYINIWAEGLVGDFDLLEVINTWANI